MVIRRKAFTIRSPHDCCTRDERKTRCQHAEKTDDSYISGTGTAQVLYFLAIGSRDTDVNSITVLINAGDMTNIKKYNISRFHACEGSTRQVDTFEEKT